MLSFPCTCLDPSPDHLYKCGREGLGATVGGAGGGADGGGRVGRVGWGREEGGGSFFSCYAEAAEIYHLTSAPNVGKMLCSMQYVYIHTYFSQNSFTRPEIKNTG